MIKYKYRFKTEQEFIDEFGYNWIERILYGWNQGGMKHLFGKEIDYRIYEKHLVDNRLMLIYNLFFKVDGWSVSKDMIKEVRITPNYNDKKTLVYD